MKKIISMVIMLLLAIGLVSAAPIEMVGSGSGSLDVTYNSPVYTDVTSIGSIDFDLNTVYDTDNIDRDFSIKDSYNYLSSGCAGTNPVLNAPDFGQFTTTETSTGNVIYQDLAFEKNYNQYLPSSVGATADIDFGTQTVNLFSNVYGSGDWQTTQRISTNEYTNYVFAREYNRNSNDKMNTDVDLTTKTTNIYASPSSVYVPQNVFVYVGDNDGASMAGNIGGIGVNFVGNLYSFDHINLPTNKGFALNIVN